MKNFTSVSDLSPHSGSQNPCDHLLMSRTEYRVWVLLSSFDSAFPSRQWIAERIDRSVGQVQRILTRLKTHGCIEINRTGRTSLYTVLVEPPSALVGATVAVLVVAGSEPSLAPERALSAPSARHQRAIAHIGKTERQGDGSTAAGAAESVEISALIEGEETLRQSSSAITSKTSSAESLRWAIAQLKSRGASVRNPVGWIINAMKQDWRGEADAVDAERQSRKDAAEKRRLERFEQGQRARSAERDAMLADQRAHETMLREVVEVTDSMGSAEVENMLLKIRNSAKSDGEFVFRRISASIADKKYADRLLLSKIHSAVVVKIR